MIEESRNDKNVTEVSKIKKDLRELLSFVDYQMKINTQILSRFNFLIYYHKNMLKTIALVFQSK